MKFRILGPLEVVVNDHDIAIPAGRQQIVLATLLLHQDQVTSVDKLAEAVWGERLPATMTNQIAVCVHALRRRFADAGLTEQIITTRPPGYVLQLPPGGVLDTAIVERRVAEAREAAVAGDLDRAAEGLAAARSVWRGSCLAGLNSPVLQPDIANWEERRLAIAEEHVQVQLDQGQHHHELIGQLRGFVAQHPLREQFRVQLMTALYRAGRQAEALEVFHDARRALDTELGLDPGHTLQEIHAAILRGEVPLLAAPERPVIPEMPPATPIEPTPAEPEAPRPAPETPTGYAERVPRMLPPDNPDYTGDDDQVELLVDVLAAKHRTAVPVALIAGRGGVGKTTTAVRVAHRVSALYPDGQLYVDLRAEHQPPANPFDVVTWFLRELGADTARIPEKLDQRTALYRSLLADRRVLVVLDNAANEGQIEPLLPAAPGCGVLVTSRTRITGLPGGRLVDLAELDPDRAVELLTRIVGAGRIRQEPTAAAELVRLCGRLPLAVRIVGARLAAKPHWSLARMVARLADDTRMLDELAHGQLEVRPGLTLSYQSLDLPARLLFRRLSLLDVVDFPAWVGAPLLQTSVIEAEDLLERLVDGRLVDVAGRDTTGQVRYRFHDLVRRYARECAEEAETTAERTAAIARVTGVLLDLAERCHRRIYGGDYVVLHGSAPRWSLDGDFADHLTESPLAWYHAERDAIVSAVRQAAAAGLAELAWDLAGSAMSTFGIRSRYDERLETHEHALAAARATGDVCGETAARLGAGPARRRAARLREGAPVPARGRRPRPGGARGALDEPDLPGARPDREGPAVRQGVRRTRRAPHRADEGAGAAPGR